MNVFTAMTQDEIITELHAMQNDPGMITKSAYTPNTELWPDNVMPFADIHLTYLKSHKQVDPRHYLSNLRLMIKVRG